jgi:retron-type reverse transcriptase
VWIPKAQNKRKLRPLSIACIKDQVVQTAILLVSQAIFEGDMLSEQYGFRLGVDAKAAIRHVYYNIIDFKRMKIIDPDLEDYFTSIPHSALMKCISRKIIDGQVL